MSSFLSSLCWVPCGWWSGFCFWVCHWILFLPQSASTITAPGWEIVLERGTTATSTSSFFLSPSLQFMSSPLTSSTWPSVSIQGSICHWSESQMGKGLRGNLGGRWICGGSLLLGRHPRSKQKYYYLFLSNNLSELTLVDRYLLSILAFSLAVCWWEWGPNSWATPRILRGSEVIQKVGYAFASTHPLILPCKIYLCGGYIFYLFVAHGIYFRDGKHTLMCMCTHIQSREWS